MSAELTAKPSTVPSRGALAMALVPVTPAVARDVLDAHLQLHDRRERVRHETPERVGRRRRAAQARSSLIAPARSLAQKRRSEAAQRAPARRRRRRRWANGEDAPARELPSWATMRPILSDSPASAQGGATLDKR